MVWEEGVIYVDVGELRAVEEGEGENGRGREGKQERERKGKSEKSYAYGSCNWRPITT